MELRDLAYFEAIAEGNHLGRAAKLLGRTQPALTKCIRRLEDDLGAALFERAGRGLKLTTVGEVLLARARTLRGAMEMTVREVTDFARGDAGHVRIGSGATTTEYLLPEVCRRLLLDNSKVTVELVVGMNDVLRASLRDGQLDLVVGPLSDAEQEFHNVPAMEDEVVVAARHGHPLFETTPTMADLAPYRWVLPAKTVAMRHWLDHAFLSRGLPQPVVQIESNSISLLPRLIAETDLLSFISRRNLGEGRVGAPLRELPLPETTMRRKLGVVYPQNVYMSPAALKIIGLIKSSADAFPIEP